MNGLVLALLTSVTAVASLQDNRATLAPNSTLHYLERALDGIERALGFFNKVYKEVNLDTVIGTRIVEASLSVLLQRLEASGMVSKLAPFVISKIRHIRAEAKKVSDLTVPYIMANEPEYYANIGPILVNGLFELDYEIRAISKTVPVWPHGSHESMKEEDSDDCIKELCGTKNGMTCAISNTCWKRMTDKGYNRYSLSHEIFYLEIAERFGCQLEMSWQITTNRQGSLRRLHDTFCANMLEEATIIADEGFQPESRDLFMEQAALCGMLGYRDFFNSKWLDNILSWQDSKDGCYKWNGWPSAKRENGARDKLSGRSKREEKRVGNGCLCHRTTVAVSALSQYVRYILDVWFQEHQFSFAL